MKQTFLWRTKWFLDLYQLKMFQRNLLLSNFRVEDGDSMSVTI